MVCPGRLADADHHGGQPIILSGGQFKKSVVESVLRGVNVSFSLHLKTTSFSNHAAVRLELATLYNVSTLMVLLSSTPSRRRLAASMILTVTIEMGPSASLQSAEQLQSRIDTTNDLALSHALGVNASLAANSTVSMSFASIMVEEEAVCPAGSWCGTGQVLPCAAGYIAPQNDSAACQPCAGGEFQSQQGQTECEPCSPGSYCPRGSVASVSGPPETFTNATNASSEADCSTCPLGHSCLRGSAVPTPCQSGTYADMQGLEQCRRCPAGHKQPLENATSCVPCERGFFASNEGQQECSQCLERMSSDSGATTCDVCADDFYLHDSSAPATQENCHACPKDAVCGWGTTLESLVLPRNHWRLSQSTVDIHSCPEEGGVEESTCVGGVDSTNGTGYCLSSYSGPRCEMCLESGTYFDPLWNRCKACPSPAIVVLACLGIIAAVAGLVAAVFWLGRADPQQLPCVMRGVAGMVRRFLDRAGSAIVRLGLQGKFKVVVSFFRS